MVTVGKEMFLAFAQDKGNATYGILAALALVAMIGGLIRTIIGAQRDGRKGIDPYQPRRKHKKPDEGNE